MNQKHSELMKLLAGNYDWQTAKSLALKLGLSERSVKYYISEINAAAHQAIASSQKGYRLRNQKSIDLVMNEINQRPWSPEERIRHIMLDVLNSCIEDQGVDIDAIGEDLNVSPETIRRDLISAKETLEKMNLRLLVQGNIFRISGEEVDKRKYYADLVFKECGKGMLRVDKLQPIFPGTDISKLNELVLDAYRMHKCNINEYALMGLVLHIVIGMERIKGNAVLKESAGGRADKRNSWLAEDLISSVEKVFFIQYGLFEREELSAIILSHITGYCGEGQSAEIDDSSFDALSKSIMDYLETHFNLGHLVKDHDFTEQFNGQLRNLLMRLGNGYIPQNSLAESIKSASPLTFECAIGIANIIEQYTHCTVHMAEVAYLALHIGDALEAGQQEKDKIACTILLPQYYNMSHKLVERIKLLFGEYISISAVLTTMEEIQSFQDDELVISTVPLDLLHKDHFILISPFLTERDRDFISEKIQKIRALRGLQKLQLKLLHVLNPKFFARDVALENSTDAISYMSDIMIREGMAEVNFTELVLERERQASTAFGRLAVPHTLKMQGIKTGIFVLINERPIPWGEQNVNVVLLFCIREEDRATFYDIFDNVISSLIEDAYIEEIMKCKSYMEFEGLMLSYLNEP